MQQAVETPYIPRPNTAGSAYNAVIRKTETPRDIEYRVFSQITAALQEAQNPGAHFTTRIRATHRNRELWHALAIDLAGEDNQLPRHVRAQLLSLAIWVSRETKMAQRAGASLQDLIDVNISIMQGLRPQPQSA